MGDKKILPLRAFRFISEMRGDPIPTSEAVLSWTPTHGYELRIGRGMMQDDPSDTPFTRVFRQPDPNGESLVVACLNRESETVRRTKLAAMRPIEYKVHFDVNKDEVLMERLHLRGGVVHDEVLGKVEMP